MISSTAAMDTDRNLLFGVLALQADLIDQQQFIDACTSWASHKLVPLAELLVARGWIQSADKSHVEYLLDRKLQKHGGDAKKGLAVVGDDLKRSLAALDDAEINRSLAGLSRGGSDLPAATLEFDAHVERFSLLHLHATGGMGRIWVARDNHVGRDVALKELRPEQAGNKTLWARFVREARICGQLEHPGIVPIYEIGRHEGTQQPFYVMRFVKGRTLAETAAAYHEQRRAGDANDLDLVAILNAYVAVCNTVAYAHSRGVIHRDLKGQNVVLGGFGEVVVLDWGLAKLMSSTEAEHVEAPIVLHDGAASDVQLTMHGHAIGTPAYMAPEQAAGRSDEIDPRTDVYGLGAMLYEILTGQPPFIDSDTRELLRKVCEETPRPPLEIWFGVPEPLERTCLRALAKRSADRFAAAAELAVEVQQWQETQRRAAQEALRLRGALNFARRSKSKRVQHRAPARRASHRK